MKNRIIALILALVMVFDMGAVAFAAGENPDLSAEELQQQEPVIEEQPETQPEEQPGKQPEGQYEIRSQEQLEGLPGEVILVSVEVTKLPDKLEYLCTDTVVDPIGGVLTLTYSDDSTQTVELSSASLSALSDDAGEVSVTASYEGMTDSFDVTVSHSYDDGVVTTEPTATTVGEMTYTCESCGDMQTSEIPMAVAESIGGACGTELTWVLSEDGVLTVSGSGTMPEYLDADAPWDNYKDKIKKIIIEDGVTNISDGAFGGCVALTEIIMPKVKQIGEAAFSGSDGLERIVIPDSVSSIGDNAFSYCTNLKEAVLSENMSYIEIGVFANCSALTSVTIPSGIEQIFENAFLQCTSLESLTIPGTVKGIDVRAFYGCKNIKTIRFEGDAPDISGNAFYNVTATAYYYADKNWTETDFQNYGGNITWEAVAETVANGTCGAEGDNLTWILDSDGVLTISGEGAMESYSSSTRSPWYAYRENIKSIVINDGVTSIGGWAFDEFKVLTNVVVSDSVTSIEECAFHGCIAITAISLPSNVSSIGRSAFDNCKSLISIAVPNAVTSIAEFTFWNCTSLTSVSVPEGITCIGENAFDYCSALESITIPDSVTGISNYAFGHCTSLTEIIFQGDASEIAEDAFIGVTATAYYDKTKAWDEADLQNYGGTITWKPIGSAAEPEERYITDADRIALENVADFELFEGSEITTNNDGNVFIDMKVQLDFLSEDEKGCYWMHDVNVVLPDDIEGIASCTVVAEGVINGEADYSVSFDQTRIDQAPGKDMYLIGISIPFKESVLSNKNDDYANVEIFLEWKDSNGNVLIVERVYCEIAEVETEPAEVVYIQGTSRFAIGRDDNFTGSFVGEYPDGTAVLDMRAKVNNLTRDGEGYYRTVTITLSGGPAGAMYCDVTAKGMQYPDILFSKTDGYGASNGTVTFTVPFTEEVVLGENLSGGISLQFDWKDGSNRIIKSESASCEIVETFSYITDTGRFSLAGAGIGFAGSRVEQYKGAYDDSVYLAINADTSVLTIEDDGYYYIPNVELKAPKGATYCQVTYLGFDDMSRIYEETVTGSVYNGIYTMNIPFTQDVMGNWGGRRIEMRMRWLDNRRNFIQHERAFCVFETQEKYIDDIWRFEIVNTLENPGVMSASKVSQYPDGVVCLDMKVDIAEMEFGPDDFYWLRDIILTAPSEEAVSCDIDHFGVRNRETVFHGRMTGIRVDEYNGNRFIGFATHFVEELLCTDRNYGNIELHFTWKDKDGKELLREIAYCEVREADELSGFDLIDGLPRDWYTVEIPESLQDSVTVHKQDGLVTITVGEATAEQWADAYLAGEPNATTIIASIHVTGPDDAEYYYDVQGGMEYESFMQRTAPDSDGWMVGRESGNGEAIAQIVVDEDGYTFVPMGNVEYGSKHRYLAWKNAANEVTRAILQQNVVVAEGVDKVEVGTDILPLASYPAESRIRYEGNDWFTGAEYDAENGSLTFVCTFEEGQDEDDLKAAIVEDEAQGSVHVWVKAPEGYDTMRTNWGWEYDIGEGGEYDFGHAYWYWEDWENEILLLNTRARTETLTWVSSVDESLPPIRETITIRYDLNGMYWMDKYWEPVPAERIKLPTIAGLSFEVVDGGIHTVVEGDVIPDAEKLRHAEAVITPPAGAKGLKFNHSGGTATADYSDVMAEEQDRLVRTSHVGKLKDAIRSLINVKELNVDGVTVVFNERLGGEDVSLFDWYDNAKCEGEPILREYIWQTEDALLYTSESDSVESEEEITEPVREPTLVGAKGWKLKLHRYPQKNGNKEHAFYFRLEARMGRGNHDGPRDKKWVVYLPFDFLGEGVDTLDKAMNKVKGNKKITINHYDENHNSIEILEGKITKNGIRFTAESFSPLMVSVEAGEGSAAYVSMVFDSMGGAPVDSFDQVLVGSTVQLPEPFKEGYDLVGWFTEPECLCEDECECEEYTSETVVLENVTLYARWARASVAAPTASIESGTEVERGTDLVLMEEGEGVEIYFTTEVEPAIIWWQYTDDTHLEITENVTIKAYARKEGYEDSEVAEFTYTVKAEEEDDGDVTSEDIPEGGIPDGIWHTDIAELPYDGTAQKPAFRLYDGKKLLVEKTDYTVAYKNNTKAAEADESDLKKSPHIIVTMKGNYSGKITIPFTIKAVELNDTDFIVSIPAQVETGKALTPKPVVTWNKTGKAIKLKTDYVMDVAGDTSKAGEYTVTLTGVGNFSGEVTAEFKVANKQTEVLMSKVSVASIKAQDWAVWAAGQDWDGLVTPEISANYKKVPLVRDVEYTVKYVNNDKVGTASVILTGTGEDGDGDGIVYVGCVTKTFKINGIAMSKVKVEGVEKAGYPYTGEEVRPELKLTYQADKKQPATPLVEDTHYTVEYQKNTAKGTGTVIFTGIEETGYTGTKKQTFKINAAQLNAETAVVYVDPCAYTAGGAVPSVLVMWGDVSLEPGVDYTVSYKNNKAVYTDDTFADIKKAPSVTIKGKGNFAGTLTEYFTINPKLLDENCGVTVVAADKVDTGKAGGWQQSFKVYDSNGKALSAGKDYAKTAEYRLIAIPDSSGVLLRADRLLDKTSVVPAGSVIQITVQGMGNYSGEVSGTYRILKKGYDIKSATIQIKDQPYTGNDIYITRSGQFVDGKVFIKVDGEIRELEFGRDFRVVKNSYVKNNAKGSAKVTFEGIGEFGGTKTVTFKIVQRAANIF